MKSWWTRKVLDRIEACLIAAVMLALVVLFLVLLAAQSARA